jgi:hypothetical protein
LAWHAREFVIPEMRRRRAEYLYRARDRSDGLGQNDLPADDRKQSSKSITPFTTHPAPMMMVSKPWSLKVCTGNAVAKPRGIEISPFFHSDVP